MNDKLSHPESNIISNNRLHELPKNFLPFNQLKSHHLKGIMAVTVDTLQHPSVSANNPNSQHLVLAIDLRAPDKGNRVNFAVHIGSVEEIPIGGGTSQMRAITMTIASENAPTSTHYDNSESDAGITDAVFSMAWYGLDYSAELPKGSLKKIQEQGISRSIPSKIIDANRFGYNLSDIYQIFINAQRQGEPGSAVSFDNCLRELKNTLIPIRLLISALATNPELIQYFDTALHLAGVSEHGQQLLERDVHKVMLQTTQPTITCASTDNSRRLDEKGQKYNEDDEQLGLAIEASLLKAEVVNSDDESDIVYYSD